MTIATWRCVIIITINDKVATYQSYTHTCTFAKLDNICSWFAAIMQNNLLDHTCNFCVSGSEGTQQVLVHYTIIVAW